MNRVFSYLRRSVVPIVAIASASVFFTACLKDKDDDRPQVPASGLMAFNLAPDQQSIVFKLSGNTLGNNTMAYTNYTGGYQPIYTGNRTVEAFDYPETNALASTSFTFEQDKYYSLFVVGYNNSYKNVVVRDNIDSLSGPNAYIRYINAIVDSVNTPTVTVTAGGANVTNDNAAYASVSELKPVAAGEVNVVVKNNNGVDVNRKFTLEASKVYTVLLVGVPGATNDAQKVQIKYITNGTVNNSTNQ